MDIITVNVLHENNIIHYYENQLRVLHLYHCITIEFKLSEFTLAEICIKFNNWMKTGAENYWLRNIFVNKSLVDVSIRDHSVQDTS